MFAEIVHLIQVVAWPGVVIVAISIFRKAIQALLAQVTAGLTRAAEERPPWKFGLGKTGVQIEAGTAIEDQKEAKPVERGLVEKEIPRTIAEYGSEFSNVREEREQLIRRDLQDLGLSETDPKTTALLIRHLAVTQLLHAAEQIYRVIFGSQIGVLKALNTAPSRQCDRSVIEEYYSGAKAIFPELQQYPLDKYIGYLVKQNLIKPADPAGSSYQITQIGKAFLKWMVDMGLREDKRF